MPAQKLQRLQDRLACMVTLKTDLLQQPGKETTNLAVVIAELLVVVVVAKVAMIATSFSSCSRGIRAKSGA